MESFGKYNLNYSNSEYYERHCKQNNEIPKQKTIEWKHWDELFDFFKGYFEYFGDDISCLDENTFKRIIKTIWRISHLHGFNEGMETMKNQIPSFREQLRNWFEDIQKHNETEMDETLSDIITPYDIWHGVLKWKK